MSRINYVGQEVEVLKGDLKGGKGTYQRHISRDRWVYRSWRYM